MNAAQLSAWRKKQSDPVDSNRSMRVSTAAALTGLSVAGWAKQVSGERMVAKTTILLAQAWDLMDPLQRIQMMALARYLATKAKPKKEDE